MAALPILSTLCSPSQSFFLFFLCFSLVCDAWVSNSLSAGSFRPSARPRTGSSTVYGRLDRDFPKRRSFAQEKTGEPGPAFNLPTTPKTTPKSEHGLFMVRCVPNPFVRSSGALSFPKTFWRSAKVTLPSWLSSKILRSELKNSFEVLKHLCASGFCADLGSPLCHHGSCLSFNPPKWSKHRCPWW